MTTMRKIGVAFAVLVALFVAFNIYYFMPRATKARITGSDVKRVDKEKPTPGETKTRDVRYVYATDFESGKAIVFRNEDNAWYFKFDSGDVTAEAAKLANNDVDEVALIRYYGVRIPILHAYPNVISIKEVDPDYVYVPWLSMAMLVVLLVLFLWGGVKVRRLFRGAKDKMSHRPPAS